MAETSPPAAADEKASHTTPRSLSDNDGGTMEPIRAVDTHEGRPACFTSTFQEVLFVLTATMAIAMSALLVGSVTVTSSFIGRDLNMSTAEITWITSASSLSSGAFLLFFGKVADLFGRKSMFVGAMFLFSVFALAAGFAKTAISLDVLNGILGLMAAAAVPPAVGILGVCYEKPSRRKNAAFACFSAGNPMGYVLGTIAGAVAANIFNWRASYWLIALIFLCFSLIGIWTIPADFTAKEPLNWETLKRFDILGTFLIVLGIGMFSAGLSLGATAGWDTGLVIALIVVGVVLMVTFVLWDLKCQYPLVPMNIFRDTNFSVALGILMLGYASFSPAAFFISLYFQDIWHDSAIQVGIRLLPLAICGLIVNIVAGIILHRVSNKLLMLVASMAYTIAFLLLTFVRHRSSYWPFCFPSFLLMVVGADLEFNVAQMYVMTSMPPAQQSLAGGIFQTAARITQTLGFAATTAIFNSVQSNPRMGTFWGRETQPYTATFLFCVAASAVSVCLIPFLSIGTQGGKEKKKQHTPPLSGGGGQSPERLEEEKTAEARVMQPLAPNKLGST